MQHKRYIRVQKTFYHKELNSSLNVVETKEQNKSNFTCTIIYGSDGSFNGETSCVQELNSLHASSLHWRVSRIWFLVEANRERRSGFCSGDRGVMVAGYRTTGTVSGGKEHGVGVGGGGEAPRVLQPS